MLRIIILCVGSACIGSIITDIFSRKNFHLIPDSMSYADLCATLLSTVSVMLTIFGIFIAILTIFSISQLKVMARKTARESAWKHVDASIQNGILHEHFAKMAHDFLSLQFKSGEFRSLIEDRVDYVIHKGAQERAVDNPLYDEVDEE